MNFEAKNTPIRVSEGDSVEGIYDGGGYIDFIHPIKIPQKEELQLYFSESDLVWDRDTVSHYRFAGQTVTLIRTGKISSNGWYYFKFAAEYAMLGWQKILQECHEGDVIQGKIINKTKDGLIAKIFTFDAVLPLSELDSDAFRKPKDFIGLTIDVKILKIYTDLHKVIVSRKNLTSHPKENNGNEKRKGGSDVIKELQSRIGKLESRIEQLETELKKLKEEPQSSLRSTVEKHDGWW